MKFTRYGKFNGLDVWSPNLRDLMEGLSDSLLSSGYDDDYYWTRQRMPQDTSLDALRREMMRGNGEGRIEEPLSFNIKMAATEKGLDFLGYKTLRSLLGSLGKSSF